MIKYCDNWLSKFEEENQENTKSVKKKRKKEHETPSQNSWGNLMQLNLVKQRENFFSE